MIDALSQVHGEAYRAPYGSHKNASKPPSSADAATSFPLPNLGRRRRKKATANNNNNNTGDGQEEQPIPPPSNWPPESGQQMQRLLDEAFQRQDKVREGSEVSGSSYTDSSCTTTILLLGRGRSGRGAGRHQPRVRPSQRLHLQRPLQSVLQQRHRDRGRTGRGADEGRGGGEMALIV